MGVLSVIKDYGTEILNAIRDNDLKTFRHICEKHLRYDAKIAELCVMDIKHRPTQKFACPLILATRLDDPSIIRYMLEIGVSPNFMHHTAYTTKRKEVLTPLHVAVELSLRRTVELLMQYNADPNVPDHNEDTPFIIAVKKADWVVMKMLLSSGANPMIPDKNSNAPIHIATLYGHLQIVKSLMKQGADIHQKGHLGTIPSHIAAKEGHVHLVQVLCSNDPGLINTKIPCYEGAQEKAMIHLASENGHAETVIALLDQFGADINLIDSQGNTPLHCLVLHHYQHLKMRDKDYFYATAKILVRYNARINERNKEGSTPLHLAAAHNHPKIVELLLNIGANPMTENNERLKPIDLVPDSDAVSKQLLKDHMLNPRPAMNVSSLSLIQNSSFHLGNQKLEHSSRNNTAKNSPMMARSYNDQSMRRQKPHNFSMSSSTSSVFIKDPKKHSYFSPRMNSELMRPIDENHTHHHLPPMGFHPSTLEQSSKSLKYLKKKKHYDSSLETSTLTESLYNRGKHRKHRYSSDDNSTINYEKQKKLAHRRHRSSDSRHHRSHRRRKGSYSYYKEDSDSTIREKKGSKSKQDHFSSDEGIRVTTVDGKPKTIEVEYEKGPITIEFENDDDIFQSEKTEKKPKRKHRKSERSDRPSKRVESRSDDHKNVDIQEWYEEMKAKKKSMKRQNLKSESESDNSSLNEEVKVVDTPQFEERRKKKKEKSKRQLQYEEQMAIERMPIVDPEPPVEHFESRRETDSDSDESEDLDDEIKKTHRLLNESATRRISEVMENMKARWSADEYESGDSRDMNKLPETNQQSYVNKNNLKRQKNKKETNLSDGDENIDESKGSKAINTSVDFSTPLIEISPNRTIKLETLVSTEKDKPSKNGADENLTIQQLSIEKETTFDVERKGSLNLKISGDTPKAYTRAEKDSARSDFILSHPARIESSSEASDNEANTASLKRRKEWSKPSPPVNSGPPKISLNSQTKDMFESNNKDPHFMKPYTSIGDIRANTDLIDMAMYEETTNTTTIKTIRTISDSKSKIIPEQYQINKNKMDSKNISKEDKSDESDNNQGNEVVQNENVTRKKNHKENNKYKLNVFKNSSKTKSSLDSLLEDYDEEPTIGRKKKNGSPIIIDLHEFKKEIEKEYSENQEFEDPNTEGKHSKNDVLNRSDDILLKKSNTTDFDFEDNSSLNNSIDQSNSTKSKSKQDRKIKNNKKIPEHLNFSSEDDESNFDSDSIRGVKKYSRNSKSKNEKNRENNDEQNSKRTTSKDSSTNNSRVLDLVGKNNKTQISDLNKLGLDIAIPSMHKNEDDEKVPYLKLDSKMYDKFIGTKQNGKENSETNNDLEARRKQKNSTDNSSRTYKPPKPQGSPIPSRKNMHNNRERKHSQKHRINNDDVDDLNYKDYQKKAHAILPKYPNKPYDVHKMSGYSDTETQGYKHPRRRNKAHSEAELSDFEAPDRSNSEMSYKQLALNSLKYKMQRNQRRFVLPRPVAHNDKNLRHLIKGNKPRKRRRKRGDHTLPSAGWYGHYELKRVISLQSFSGSEFDIDPDVSFISDEEWSSEDISGSNLSLYRKNENPVYDSLMKFQKLNESRVEMRDKENEPIASLEPDPILLQKYDAIARLWMEQVDKETLQKFKTMYLSVLPEGQNLHPSLYSPQPDEFTKLPQWVVAKSRARSKAKVLNMSAQPMDEVEGAGDVSMEKNHVIFFKVGYNWIELAWVLFDRLQEDSQTVRMIKDIQLKDPENLPEQIIDMMNRWWSMKGDKATIQELQRSLDLAQMFYIVEDVSLNEEEETELMDDELKTGVVEDNTDISNIKQKYTDKSLNGSYAAEKGGKTFGDLSADEVLRKVQSSKMVPVTMNEKLVKKQHSRAGKSKEDSNNFSTHDVKHQPAETTFSASENDNVIFLKKKSKKPIKHETNL